MNYHHTKSYRYWRKRVTIRGKGKCAITGSKVNLCTHHLWSGKYYPKYRYHVKKGVLITNKLHSMFHNHYMGGFRVKCTKKDWDNFLIELEDNLELFMKSNLL